MKDILEGKDPKRNKRQEKGFLEMVKCKYSCWSACKDNTCAYNVIVNKSNYIHDLFKGKYMECIMLYHFVYCILVYAMGHRGTLILLFTMSPICFLQM